MDPNVTTVVEAIETALTPVFLLAGTGGFLNVFVARLARISDRVNEIFDIVASREGEIRSRQIQLAHLRRRTLALEIAVILASLSGVCTCISVIGLLAGAIREQVRDQLLFWFFGAAVAGLIGALLAFLFEMLIAGYSMIRQMAGRDAYHSAPNRQHPPD